MTKNNVSGRFTPVSVSPWTFHPT